MLAPGDAAQETKNGSGSRFTNVDIGSSTVL